MSIAPNPADSSQPPEKLSRQLSPLLAVFPAAVSRPDDFFDREETLQDVLNTLHIAARRPIVLQGERGIGKTSLLLHIGHALQNEAIPGRRFAHFFISPARLDAWEQFALELLDGLSLTLEGLGLPVRAWEEGNAFQTMGYNRLITLVKRLMEPALYRDPRLGIVVVMDEIDKGGVRPHVLDNILAGIHYLVEKAELPLYFLMTIISRNLPDPPAGSPLPVKFIRIPPLSAEALREMVVSLSRNEGAPLPPEQLQSWIAHYSGGHPYIAKLLLAAILKEHPAKDAFWRPEDALARALRMEEARQLFGDVYRRFFSEEEKAIMLELAARPEGQIALPEVQDWPLSFRQARLTLEQRGYIERQGDFIRCRVALWPAWLRAWPAFELERQAHPLPSPESMPRQTAPDLPSGLCIVRSTQQVFVDGREIDERAFTRTTFRALLYLAEHAGEVVSKDALGQAVYLGEHYAGSDQQLDTIIFRLRKALGDAKPYQLVKTLRGRGYRIDEATILDAPPPHNSQNRQML